MGGGCSASRPVRATWRARARRLTPRWKKSTLKAPSTVGTSPQRDCVSVGARLVLCLLNSYTLVAPILGSGEARRGSIPRRGAVTEEQRSQNPKAPQPAGRHVFLAQPSLFAPHRSPKDMLVTHASAEPKIHCRQCIVISETQHRTLAAARPTAQA